MVSITCRVIAIRWKPKYPSIRLPEGLSSPVARAPSPREVPRRRAVVVPPVVVEVESLEEKENLEAGRGLPEVAVAGDRFLIGERFGLAAGEGDVGQDDPDWEAEDDQQAEDDGGEEPEHEEAWEVVEQENSTETPPPQPAAEPVRRSRTSWSHTVRADEYEEFNQDAYIPMPRQESYRPVWLVPFDGPGGEPVRVVGQYWADPRPERVLHPGHHYVVRMSVGQRSFRITLDTGAAPELGPDELCSTTP